MPLTCIQQPDSESPDLLRDVAEKHPEWKVKIESFRSHMSTINRIIETFSTAEVDPAHVSKFREARIRPMLDSAARNVDEAETSLKAKRAPTTTDSVESGFGTLDQALHKTGASLSAVFGITMMRRTHMLQSTTEIKGKSRPEKLRKLKEQGVKVGYGEEIEDDSARWNLCSLMNRPKDERFALYRAVLAAYDEECVLKPRKEILDHDQASYQRQVKKSEDAEKALFKRAVRQAVWLKKQRAFSKVQLSRMLVGQPHSKTLQVLRDQVNIRRHVDGNKEPIPKREGGWLSGPLSADLVSELRGHVSKMVQNEHYTKPPAIVQALQPEQRAAFANKDAK